ncbi:hypothetical protein KW801_02150, partial [Candidatus Saccharibacteria bacterium]|nr:hypothetical protein [Candidatus Saccharibacteria bacterium]
MSTQEQEPQPPARIEIEATNSISLKQLYIEHAQTYLDLINFDREHLSKFNDGTAEKYPDVYPLP